MKKINLLYENMNGNNTWNKYEFYLNSSFTITLSKWIDMCSFSMDWMQNSKIKIVFYWNIFNVLCFLFEIVFLLYKKYSHSFTFIKINRMWYWSDFVFNFLSNSNILLFGSYDAKEKWLDKNIATSLFKDLIPHYLSIF